MSTGVGDEARLYAPRLKLTSGDRYRLFRKTTKYSADQPKTMTGEFANKRDRLSKLLTRATRDLSATTNTPQGFRNIAQYGGNAENFTAETGGSTFRSAEMSFYIDDESVILDAQLRFVITGYRTYERDVAADPGSGATSSSGGSSAPTSGASTASTSNANDDPHVHYWADYMGSGGSGTVKEYLSGDGGTSIFIETDSNQSMLTSTELTEHVHGIAHTHTVSIGAHTHDVSVAAHSHAQTYDIFEDTNAPGAITVKLDGVNINSLIFGPFTVTLGQAVDVSLTGILTNAGWHTLRFETASGKGRVCPYILVRSLNLQP